VRYAGAFGVIDAPITGNGMMINRTLAGANQATGGLVLPQHDLPVDVAGGAICF
jgi:hypothetical protein